MEECDTESISSTPPPAYARRTPKLSPLRTVAFAFSCLGVIYSDIGTSPLYVISTIFPPTEAVPSKEDVIGIISAIIWSFTLLPLLKYVSLLGHNYNVLGMLSLLS
jgi:KUP system potassium uptake protein